MHRVQFVEALLTKLPGTFDNVTTERDRSVRMIDAKADAEFFHFVLCGEAAPVLATEGSMKLLHSSFNSYFSDSLEAEDRSHLHQSFALYLFSMLSSQADKQAIRYEEHPCRRCQFYPADLAAFV